MIVAYHRDDAFEGDEIRVDEDFVPALDRLGDYASSCGIVFHVTSAYRRPGVPVKGAIVPPAARSNHHVGHAIDANPVIDGRLYASTALKDWDTTPPAFRDLVRLVRADQELRWGGDFISTPDVVHFDDGLNLRHPDQWQRTFDAVSA